ncbi:MAG: PP2C family protein-serine/threonine phosphatase [Selenomonadaceae bacterium]|nr:PP2C family protein-serine/threonine phosphatase [Selenomonadaceae bacterium]
MLISGIWLAEKFSSSIKHLSDGVKEISGGNLDKKFDIHTGDEIEQLADGFNTMTTELKNQMQNLATVTAEKERIAAELNIAHVIQLSMLPHDFPNAKKFTIYAIMESAKEVGGDFYDFYWLDENHLAITIADVSSKGIPAALFIVISKTTLKNLVLTSNESNLANLVSHANNILRQDNTARMFVTAFIGILDTRTGKLIYVNAGHNPPVFYRASENKFESLSVIRNFFLVGRRGIKYKEQEIILSCGDCIFLYTDGVTEAFNEVEELYGEEKLLTTLNELADKTADVKFLLGEIWNSLAKHVGKAEQSDDITMLGLTYRDKN